MESAYPKPVVAFRLTAELRVTLLVVTILISAGCDSTEEEAACPDGEVRWERADGGNGHLYCAVLVPDGISWTESNEIAETLGTGWHLAAITSAEENAFVYSLVSNNQAFWNRASNGNSGGPWLGGLLVGPGRTYGWVTEELFTYSNWGPNEPFGNGDRLALFGHQAPMGPLWNDVPADRPESGYILENPSR